MTRSDFEQWADQFDHDSNEWEDMGRDEIFLAGMAAAKGSSETSWKNVSSAPLDRPILLRESNDVYKGAWDSRYGWVIFCGQPATYTPEPEEWTEIPK